MRRWPGTLVAVSLACATLSAGADIAQKPAEHWEISGDLSEACTCAVPCTCNFGERPSPRHYCWSMFSIAIDKGHYGDVKLDGLHLAGAHGKKTAVWYLDGRANPQQAAALKAIAGRFLRSHRYKVYFETARITQEVGEKGNKLEVAGRGGFEADYIVGLDGKTPVVVENNTTWNMPQSIKGKTKEWRYRDTHGNKFDFRATNSNEGKFDWTDETPNLP
jgi:hypothetical protein